MNWERGARRTTEKKKEEKEVREAKGIDLINATDGKREEGVAGESDLEETDCTSSKDVLVFNTAPNPGQMAMS